MARRTFFSFHYEPDCLRAWNVRNSWVVRPADEESRGFFDASVFERSKREGDQALKAFLRNGLENTSVTCVLAGTETWTRRWVRYEIARSILKGNGLLTVHIHGVRDMNKGICAKGAAISKHCSAHDFAADDGRNRIGGWIEAAAKRAGR